MIAPEDRLRLSACRIEDRHDPFFSGALARAAQDPELAHWWTAQRAIDQLLAEKLRTLSPPRALREGLPGSE